VSGLADAGYHYLALAGLYGFHGAQETVVQTRHKRLYRFRLALEALGGSLYNLFFHNHFNL
jgi:hypothetical protein